jgi:hypothetical protein
MTAYVLHFDINKTVLMTDSAGGKGLSDVLNSAIAESVLGNYDKTGQKWVPAGKALYGHVQKKDTLMHYGDYVNARIQEKPEDKQHKEKWKACKATFTDNFKIFKSSYDIATIAMNVAAKRHPSGVCTHDLSDADLRDECVANSCGDVPMLIPSFYEMIEYLRKNKTPTTIIFRTFGDDVHAVCSEFTRAMIGNQWTHDHPKDECTARYLQTLKPKKWQRKGEPKGYMAHSSHEEHNTIHMDLAADYFDRTNTAHLTKFSNWLNDTKNGRPFTKDGYTIRVKFVHDNHAIWGDQKENKAFGKLFFIDTDLRKPHHIFFDDNLESEDAHIVAAYTDTNPTDLTYENLVDTYTFRADPYFAITDKRYFIDALRVCTMNRNASITDEKVKVICTNCHNPKNLKKIG